MYIAEATVDLRKFDVCAIKMSCGQVIITIQHKDAVMNFETINP